MGAALQSALLQPVAFNSHGAERPEYLSFQLVALPSLERVKGIEPSS
jgi:hypothetical protein